MKPSTFNARVALIVARAELPWVRMWEDAPDKRIKIQFAMQPDEITRSILRNAGFRYRGGSANYWIRKIDSAGRNAAAFVMTQLTERTPEDNA